MKILEQLKTLRDESDFRQKRILYRQIGNQIADVRDDLLRILGEEQDKGIKIVALEILAASQDQTSTPALQQLLISNEPIEVLQTAATVLGKLKSESSFETLVSLLRHPNANVRLGSVYGLMALGDKRAVRYLLNSVDDKEHVRCWWPSPKAGGYTVGQEASAAIDALTGFSFRGNKPSIERWIKENLN